MASRNAALDAALLRLLKDKAEGTVIIFDRGEYYFCVGEDALLVARQVFRSEVGMKRIEIGGRRMAYVTMGTGQYERVLRDLLLNVRYRVELYSAVPREGTWRLSKKGTVGNMADFEDVGELGKETSGILAIRIPRVRKMHSVVAVGIIDTCSLRMTYGEVEDDYQLSNLEQCIMCSNAKECLLIGVPPPDRLKLLKGILKKSNILLTQKQDVSNVDCIRRVLRREDKDSLGLSDSVLSCLANLVEYADLREENWMDKFTLFDYCNGNFMRLDTAAVKAFELFNTAYRFGADTTNGTMFATLNKCKTSGGRALLKQWLARPLCDIRRIRERQQVMDGLCACTEERRSLHRTFLPKLPDLTVLARKMLRRKARLIDCYRVYQSISVLKGIERTVRRIMEQHEESRPAVKEMLLVPVVFGIVQFAKFEELVESTFDEMFYLKAGTMRVKPEIDPELLSISDQMKDLEKKCKRAHSKIQARLNTEVIKMDVNNTHGYFFRVTLKEEKRIRDVKGLRILDTSKGNGVRFRDADLDQLNDEYLQLFRLYSQAQSQLESSIVQVCAGYAPSLSLLASQLSILDVFVSLSTVAEDAARPHVRPELTEQEGIFDIRECRHPVLDPLIEYIPNDVLLSETRAVIVTGANMGGKSTYLRAAALCCLLAQMGARVPAAYARFSIVRAIYARVGASDKQGSGISTFMAEMMECAHVLKMADKHCLVIIDELGRGTSTYDGFGLAWGITQDLIERVQCKCLVATHFRELAEMEERVGGVRAMQMTVHAEGDHFALLYHAEKGRAGASFGLHVAKLVGIRKDVLAVAEKELQFLNKEEEKKELWKRKVRDSDMEHLRENILSCP